MLAGSELEDVTGAGSAGAENVGFPGVRSGMAGGTLAVDAGAEPGAARGGSTATSGVLTSARTSGVRPIGGEESGKGASEGIPGGGAAGEARSETRARVGAGKPDGAPPEAPLTGGVPKAAERMSSECADAARVSGLADASGGAGARCAAMAGGVVRTAVAAPVASIGGEAGVRAMDACVAGVAGPAGGVGARSGVASAGDGAEPARPRAAGAVRCRGGSGRSGDWLEGTGATGAGPFVSSGGSALLAAKSVASAGSAPGRGVASEVMSTTRAIAGVGGGVVCWPRLTPPSA